MPHAHSIPFELTSNGIEFLISINNTQLKCVLDSGATDSILFKGSYRKSIQKRKNLLGLNSITIPTLSMGTLFKTNMNFIAPDLENVHFDILLGLDFLLQHEVFIDFKLKRISIIEIK
ncbi:MAG: hypothetical protein Q8S21_00160 [Candidatus Paracaedibacteraceae bacterium]|nr:hypothetical protein [Candidatus Paracaedibacteraceae bacterium]